MLTYLLVWIVGLGSLSLYLAGYLFREVRRPNDLIWSGIGLFYALMLWVYASRIRGGFLLGEAAGVALLVWLGWQTMTQRRALTPPDQQTPVPPTLQKIASLVQQAWDKVTQTAEASLSSATSGSDTETSGTNFLAGLAPLKEKMQSLFKGKSSAAPTVAPSPQPETDDIWDDEEVETEPAAPAETESGAAAAIPTVETPPEVAPPPEPVTEAPAPTTPTEPDNSADPIPSAPSPEPPLGTTPAPTGPDPEAPNPPVSSEAPPIPDPAPPLPTAPEAVTTSHPERALEPETETTPEPEALVSPASTFEVDASAETALEPEPTPEPEITPAPEPIAEAPAAPAAPEPTDTAAGSPAAVDAEVQPLPVEDTPESANPEPPATPEPSDPDALESEKDTTWPPPPPDDA